MTSQGIDPLGRRYEIIDFTGKAEATFATEFQQLPMAAAANWHDMREEVDQEIYRPQALDLGVVRLNQSSQYKKVLFYMTKKDVGIISEKSTTPTEMTRAMLDNIIWHAPYRFTFDKDGKSNHTKVKALAFYYFLDMGISDEFVDPDARFFEAFKFACINVAGKMVDIEDDREARARQRRKDKKARKKAMSQHAHSRSGQWSEGLQEPSHQRVTEDENDENHGMENHDEEGNYEEPPNAVQPRRLSDYQDQEASNKRHKSEHDRIHATAMPTPDTDVDGVEVGADEVDAEDMDGEDGEDSSNEESDEEFGASMLKPRNTCSLSWARFFRRIRLSRRLLRLHHVVGGQT